MSRTNYEAVADFAGHWLHRAQVSLLTGEIGQINRVSHIAAMLLPKNPGAGLVRAWCALGLSTHTTPESRGLQGNFSERPECHSKTEAAEPVWLQDRSRGAGLAPRPKPRSQPRSQGHLRTVTRAETCAEEGLVCLTHQQAATPVRGCVKHTNPRNFSERPERHEGPVRARCESTTPLRYDFV